MVRAGLELGPANRDRPRVGRRRRLLAIATSTGLTAPMLALDGIPVSMDAPNPVQWDELGIGSATVVTAAAGTVREAPDLVSSLTEETTHMRRATPWVRAAGVEGQGVATHDEIAAAGAVLQVDVGDTVDGSTVELLRHGYAQRADGVVTALGLSEQGSPARATDVEAAAAAFSIPTPAGVTPQVVEAVRSAGEDVVEDRIEETVTPYARALGLDTGRRPTPADTQAVAAELGLELPDVPDVTEAEQLHHAWLQTLRPYFARVGVNPEEEVDPVDLVALGGALGADLDPGVGPAEVADLLAVLDDPAFVPPVVGTIGGAALHMPSRDVLLAGWHEAAGPTALPMQPRKDGVATTLPSRGRPSDPHSALDVAVTPGTQVTAPVTGTVVEAIDYMLYGRHADTRIVIRPDDNAEVEVAVLHVTGPLVQPGDHVEAGDPLASHSTQFPFSSQIDRFAGRAPHVHIEVKPAA